MIKYLVAGAVALGSAGVANAAPTPTIIFTPGVYTVPGFTTAQVFEGFGAGGTATGQQFTPGQGSGVYAESKTGDVRIQPGSQNQTGVAFNPDVPNGNDNYLSIENGTFNVALGAGVQVFSFVLGTLDNYNSVTLTFADSSTLLLSGLGIISGAANNTAAGAAPASFGQTGRVTYDLGGQSAITNIAFTSTQAAFEIDDLAAAAPEPAAWALMILGFGLVGYQLRSRRRKPPGSVA